MEARYGYTFSLLISEIEVTAIVIRIGKNDGMIMTSHGLPEPLTKGHSDVSGTDMEYHRKHI